MADGSNPTGGGEPRQSPRVVVSLPVEVEVSGQKRQLNLISKDIGGGGIFLRTNQPSPLWSKVNISLTLADGTRFTISGEVVRSVTPEKSRNSGHPAGMAVAFDEASRNKQKELVTLVLEICSNRASKPEQRAPVQKTQPITMPPAAVAKEEPNQEDSEVLLDEIDKLLDSVEIDLEESSIDIDIEPEPPPAPSPKQPEKNSLKTRPATPKETTVKKNPSPISPPKKQAVGIGLSKTTERKSGQLDHLRHYITEYKRTRKGSTYYHVLGVEQNASSGQIEKAYQELLKRLRPQCSPDLLPENLLQELTRILGKIRKAFAILSKPDRRDAYDFLIDDLN